MKKCIFLLAAFFLSCSALLSQSPPKSLTNSRETAPSFDPAAATQAWLDSVPAEERAKSNAYFEGGYWIELWRFLLGVALGLVLLGSGLSAGLRDLAQKITRSKNIQVALYAIAIVPITWLVTLPFSIYADYFREHAYGLATQSFSSWFRDSLVNLGVSLVAVAVLMMVLYAFFRRAPRTWWLWGSVVALVFLAVSTLISPVLIDPLFNTYTPIADPKISEPILAMARANEVPVRQVFEVNASRQSNRVSANVAGLFGTARIALNDNLLKQCTLPEIREVMAHEMGHYVLNHGMKLLVYFGIFVCAGFAFARAAFERCVRRWGTRWRVRGIDDPAGFPLLVLLFQIFFFFLTPLSNTVVRTTEREADAFAINTAREPDAAAKVALKLGAYRKLDPGPLEEFIFFDHPSGRARIRMAMDWKAAKLPAGEIGMAEPPR